MRLIWLDFIYPVCCVGVCALGFRLYKRSSSTSTLVERWMLALLPLAAFILLARVVQEMLAAPFQIWDTVRLLPSYLLAHRLPIYYPPDRGPVLDQMYGPMTAIAYLPVTYLTHSPAWAAALAKLFTVTYFFGPICFLMKKGMPHPCNHRILYVYCLLAALYYAVNSPALSGSGFWNHADSPALGACAIGCLLLYFGKEKEGWKWQAISAIFVILSIWTKQVSAPLLIALPCYLWIARGRRLALQYAGMLFVCGLIISGIFVYLHGFRNLWFNLIANPAQEPWQMEMVKIQGLAIVELMERSRWLSILQVGYIFYDLRRGPSPRHWRTWLDENRWTLFSLVGVCMVPTSLMGRMKAGGDMNALSFTMYFLLMATLALGMKLISRVRADPENRFTDNLAQKFVFVFVASAVIIQMPTLSYSFLRLSRTCTRLQTNPASVAFEYDRRHPGEVYMPWNCLETFLAEGEVYHFEYGVFDREIANLPIAESHLQSGLPAHMRYIAYPFNEQARYLMKHFPEYSFPITLPGLPGWTVYSRAPAHP